MRTKRRRKFSWYLIWFVVFFFLVSAAFSFFISLPLWKINDIRVIGTKIVSTQEITRAAEYLTGENVFLADYSRLKAAIDKVHQIEDFGIWRRLPSSVVIKVVEREPFAVVISTGRSFIVDKDGFYLQVIGGYEGAPRYRFVKIENSSLLPVVKGVASDKLLSDRIEGSEAASIAQTIDRISRFLPVSSLQLEISGREGVSLLIQDILKVRLGEMDEMEKKISVLEALILVIEGKWNEVAYIDIRVADNPVIKYRKR